jgi:hypothetical protein
VPRSRRWWRDRLRLIGVTLAGAVAGILIGLLLVKLIIGRWGEF